MSEQSREPSEAEETAYQRSPGEQDNHGGLSVEDDPDGTQDPADLAGSASPDDARVGYEPSASEADER